LEPVPVMAHAPSSLPVGHDPTIVVPDAHVALAL
jgi:hypothetical protein